MRSLSKLALVVVLAGCTTPAVVGSGTGSPGDTRTCDQITGALDRELAEIQACTTDAECGQVLQGTSCGCTHDLVARWDADLERFEDLVAEGQAGECDLGFTSPCDCPQGDGFQCTDGTCEWRLWQGGGHGIPACTAEDGDRYDLSAIRVEADELVAEVGYGGGCEEHQFRLCWPSQDFAPTDGGGVSARLELQHDANNDGCEAFITEERRFALPPLAEAWQVQVGTGPQEILLRVGDHTATYAF